MAEEVCYGVMWRGFACSGKQLADRDLIVWLCNGRVVATPDWPLRVGRGGAAAE